MTGLTERTAAAVVADILSTLGVPSATLNAAFETIMQRRQEAAREIILEELRRGEKTIHSVNVDEVVPILYRYQRAAAEGAARLNLRLLAQAIAGRAHLNALYADEFLRLADVVAALRREEILLLAKMHHVWKSDWLHANDERMRPAVAVKWCVAKLVPNVLPDEQTLYAVAAGLVRTGFIESMPAIGRTMYQPTPLLDALVEISSLDAAVEAEAS